MIRPPRHHPRVSARAFGMTVMLPVLLLALLVSSAPVGASHPRAGPIVPPPPGGTFDITITETGLPSAQKITWGVTVSGATHRTNATTLTLTEPVGGYLIGFLNAGGYEPNTTFQTVTVSDSPVFLEVTYALAQSIGPDPGSGDGPATGLFGLPGTEGTLLLLVVVGGGIALAAVVWIRRNRRVRRAPPTEIAEEEEADRVRARKRSGNDGPRGRRKDPGGAKRSRRRRDD